MYIPNQYKTEDKAEIVAFMKQYSFATIVTCQDNLPQATHLPFVIQQQDQEVKLISHFAKANKQWMDVETGQVLIIFSEPHAYISPSHYDKELSVPTWNYVAVHVYGKGKLITDPAKAYEVIEDTIDSFEPEYARQWHGLPTDFKEKLMNGIVAFEIEISSFQAVKKLSQNKTDEEQSRIIHTLQASPNTNESDIAAYMQHNLNAKGVCPVSTPPAPERLKK